MNKHQNDLNVKLLDFGDLNVKCQNDLNVKLFDVGHLKVECQNDMNGEPQTL